MKRMLPTPFELVERTSGKWAPLVESNKRPRRDEDEDSGSSEDSFDNSSSPKALEELKAITWELREPAPVTVDGDGSIAVNGDTIYVNPEREDTLYAFSVDKGEWVCSIECDRKSFGLAVINRELTLVGGESKVDGSDLKTLTCLVNDESGTKWLQKHPPMVVCKGKVKVCYSKEYLVVANKPMFRQPNMEVMDVKTKKWNSVKFSNNYGNITRMTILGDRVYVLSTFNSIDRYCAVSTCSLSALLETQPLAIAQQLVWHKLHPITDLFRPSLANLGGNLVAIGGKKTIKERLFHKQCSISPVLYVYSDKVDSKGWNFVADLPHKHGYPNADFLLATLQSNRLIVCGGTRFEQHTHINGYIHSIGCFGTDIVHVSYLK